MNSIFNTIDQINYNTMEMYVELLYIQYDCWVVDRIVAKMRYWKNKCIRPCFPKRKSRWISFLKNHFCNISYIVSLNEFILLEKDIKVYQNHLYSYIKDDFLHLIDTATLVANDSVKIKLNCNPEVILTLLIKKGIIHDRPNGTKVTIDWKFT